MEFWYDDECVALSKRLGTEIHVRVDPMLHPERSRIEPLSSFASDSAHVIRVGDEHEVELLSGPTSESDVGRSGR